MTFSLARPGITYNELAGLIPIRPNQLLNVLVFVQGKSNLPGAYSAPTPYTTFNDFLQDSGAATLAYEKQAVASAFAQYAPIWVIWLKTHSDLQAALDGQDYSGLTCYPYASTLAAAPRNAAYTALLPWVTRNSGEIFGEPSVTVAAGVSSYVTATPQTVTNIQADRALLTLTSPNGHWRYYAPNLPSTVTDGGGTWYMSAACMGAAVQAKRAQIEGIRQPGAGRKCGLNGISPFVPVLFTDAQIGQLTDAKINPIHRLFGVWQPYGASTQATLEAFVSAPARQIFNTIRKGAIQLAQQVQWESIDGQGELFQAAQTIYQAYMYSLWFDGALYGQTPEEAYTIICDETNNPAEDLEAAILSVSLYAIPSPFSQQVEVTTVRQAIGSLTTAT